MVRSCSLTTMLSNSVLHQCMSTSRAILLLLSHSLCLLYFTQIVTKKSLGKSQHTNEIHLHKSTRYHFYDPMLTFFTLRYFPSYPQPTFNAYFTSDFIEIGISMHCTAWLPLVQPENSHLILIPANCCTCYLSHIFHWYIRHNQQTCLMKAAETVLIGILRIPLRIIQSFKRCSKKFSDFPVWAETD